VNPCPANCERGERLGVRESKYADGVQYQANYRCYLPELVVNQPRRVLSEPGAPQRTNCGTFWTGRQSDPSADANPCPANCELGELLGVRRGRSGDKLYYEMNYRCYVARPRPADGLGSGAPGGVPPPNRRRAPRGAPRGRRRAMSALPRPAPPRCGSTGRRPARRRNATS
jgi:hypothetical protein